MPPKATQQDFIMKSKLIFGDDALDYSQCEYKNSVTKIILICNKGHGPFEVFPGNHINKKIGCSMCDKRVTTTEHFKIKSREIHGLKYNYDKVVFTGAKDYVTINCPIDGHGDFMQRADNHYSAQNGCPECGLIHN